MEKHQISLIANGDEYKAITALKEYHKRNTNADFFRFLLKQEYEKTFQNITSIRVDKSLK